MKIAYVRVSTVEQNEARQIEALKKYDIDKWFTEKVSAKDTNRPQLQAMIDFAREGDTIYIHDFSRLARSTADLLKLVEEEQLSAGHARALLGAPTAEFQRQAAKKVIADGLSVRQTEALVKALQREKKAPPKQAGDSLALYLGEAEKNLSGRLGRKVHIAHRGKKGRIELEYYNSQDLELLLEALERLNAGEVQGHG